jgi:uncharacterized membrane protein
MGSGMVFFASSRREREWGEGRIVRHFVLRGLLLIALQLFIENLAWVLGALGGANASMHPPGGGSQQIFLHFGVLYGLGAAMIAGAMLGRVRSSILIVLSVALLVVTQIATPDPARADVLYSPLLRLLFIPGRSGFVQVLYPLVPWLALTLLGMVFGRELLGDRERAHRRALRAGAAFIVLFFVVRLLGGFGNLHPRQGSDWISFFNVTKYPPSLCFVLLTLGSGLVLLFVFDGLEGCVKRWGGSLLVFGRTPLFFYIAHLYLFAAVTFALPDNLGMPLMYALWLLGLAVLYWPCRRYGRFKGRRRPESVWRFF